ncbi:hypothetical protein KC19_VG274200 [Ceratodon purpureus]|uniref:Gfo/Idh/MocA-like oxidoreductase N-terminal domain-containing protein n=1 Tax=Ceratodon purpureus TaxID=3225 RepID=A0A8T0HUW1_CERPU|nr:hypothetical protein KC19_VG274200 [Ceratodon purpureus]
MARQSVRFAISTPQSSPDYRPHRNSSGPPPSPFAYCGHSQLGSVFIDPAFEIGGSIVVEEMADSVPGLALLGSGVFASSQYIPKLGELVDLISLKVIWSRSEDAAKKALQLVNSYAPNAEAKWGQEGLDSVLQDKAIHAVAVVLPAQYQLEIVLRILEAGKHVIQEKPVGSCVADVRKAWSAYQALASNNSKLPIWAVAENYRFEPALI